MTEQRFKSVFDIIGPTMIGPSSSHTAGACRIGKVVRTIFGEEPKKVEIYLYDSFAKTGLGHGTDIALVGGLLGMDPDDSRLASSLKLAYEHNMDVSFSMKKEKADHPNSVRLIVSNGKKTLNILGISIGGGSIQISELNGFKIHLSLGTPTLIIVHKDLPGMISKVSSILSQNEINIGTMTVTRVSKGDQAIMIIEVDQKPNKQILEELRQISKLESANFFE